MLKVRSAEELKSVLTFETLSRDDMNPFDLKEVPKPPLRNTHSRYTENLCHLASFVEGEFVKRFGVELKREILNYNHPVDVIRSLSPYLMLRDLPEVSLSAFEESLGIRDAMVDGVQRHSRGKILDIGCGSGVMTTAIGAELGVDINETSIALAKMAFPSLPCIHDNVETMQLNSIFNTITMIVSFHEIEHRRKAILNLRRHLSPEGNILVIEFDENIPWVKSMFKAAGMKVTEQTRLGRWFVHDHFCDIYLVEAEKRKPTSGKARRR